MADISQALPVGSVLTDQNRNRYRITDVLGRGGSGIVYAAQKEGSGLELAIKEFYPCCEGILRGSDMTVTYSTSLSQKRFYDLLSLMDQEQVIGSAASSRNGHALGTFEKLEAQTLTIDGSTFDAGQGHFYLSLSYDGKFVGLNSAIDESQSPSPEYRIRLFKACVEAVEAIHDKGIIHRDLTPGNIAIFDNNIEDNRAGSAILLDFGLSRWADGRDQLTTDFILTTPGYCAPELLDIEHPPISYSVDVYSLGCIFYTILYGKAHTDDTEVMLMPGRARAIGASEYMDEINRVLSRATATDPSERYPNASRLLEAVEELLAQVTNPEFAAPVWGVSDIHNRDRELAEVLQLISRSGEAGRVIIHGQSGIGKTTFLQLLGQKLGRVIYTTYNESLRQTIASLKIAGEDPQSLSNRLKEERHFYRNLAILSRYSAEDVLIIDKYNTDRCKSLEELLDTDRLLETLSSCKIKVILATNYDYDKHLYGTTLPGYELGSLSDQGLLELLYGTGQGQFFSQSPELGLRLIEHFDRNTLLVQLAAAIFNDNRLASDPLSLYRGIMHRGNESGRIIKDGAIVRTDLNSMMNLMWDVTRFEVEEQLPLILATAIPEGGIDAELFNSMLRGYASYSQNHCDRNVIANNIIKGFQTAINLKWIAEQGGRYYVHALIRSIITDKLCEEHAGEELSVCIASLNSCIDFLEYVSINFHSEELWEFYYSASNAFLESKYIEGLYLCSINEEQHAFWSFYSEMAVDNPQINPELISHALKHMADIVANSGNRDLYDFFFDILWESDRSDSIIKDIHLIPDEKVQAEIKVQLQAIFHTLRKQYNSLPSFGDNQLGEAGQDQRYMDDWNKLEDFDGLWDDIHDNSADIAEPNLWDWISQIIEQLNVSCDEDNSFTNDPIIEAISNYRLLTGALMSQCASSWGMLKQMITLRFDPAPADGFHRLILLNNALDFLYATTYYQVDRRVPLNDIYGEVLHLMDHFEIYLSLVKARSAHENFKDNLAGNAFYSALNQTDWMAGLRILKDAQIEYETSEQRDAFVNFKAGILQTMYYYSNTPGNKSEAIHEFAIAKEISVEKRLEMVDRWMKDIDRNSNPEEKVLRLVYARLLIKGYRITDAFEQYEKILRFRSFGFDQYFVLLAARDYAELLELSGDTKRATELREYWDDPEETVDLDGIEIPKYGYWGLSLEP